MDGAAGGILSMVKTGETLISENGAESSVSDSTACKYF